MGGLVQDTNPDGEERRTTGWVDDGVGCCLVSHHRARRARAHQNSHAET